MADSLRVFGVDYPDATGIKAYDINGNLLTFTRATGTKTITENGTYSVADYEYAAVSIVPEGVSLQSKSATPLTQSQIITADSGYDGLSSVEVAAIPSQYIVPSGTLNITENGTQDVTSYAAVSVNVDGGVTINNQSKTATPTESQQVITYDSGYTGLEQVTVNAISSTYVGSGVSRRTSTDLTASGAEISVPAGYYSEAASKSVATGSAGTPTAAKGAVSNHSITVTPSVTNTTGYITGGTKTGTGVTVTAAELVSGSQTATTNDTYDVTNLASMVVNVTPSLQSKTASVTPTESTQTQTVTADTGYDGLNEVEVSVGAISSTYVGSEIPRQSSSSIGFYAQGGDAWYEIPAGYYASDVLKYLSTISHASPIISVDSTTGLITATHTQSSRGYLYKTGTTSNTQQLSTQAAATITPTTTSQVAVAANKYTLGDVTVAAIPSQYIVPSGNLAITENGTGINVTNYATVSVNVPEPSFVTYYTGSTDPASSLGSDGDIYFKVVS